MYILYILSNNLSSGKSLNHSAIQASHNFDLSRKTSPCRSELPVAMPRFFLWEGFVTPNYALLSIDN